MNALTQLGAASLADTSLSGLADSAYTLRRTGRKPLRFKGVKLLETAADDQAAASAAPLGYDITIYKTSDGKWVLELAARRARCAAQDMQRVECFHDLEMLAQYLQTYCCAQDVPVPSALASGSLPLAVAALQAVQLRETIARIEDEYHTLLSDIFEALELSEEPCCGADSGAHG